MSNNIPSFAELDAMTDEEVNIMLKSASGEHKENLAGKIILRGIASAADDYYDERYGKERLNYE